MKRSAALGLLGVFILGFGALCATAAGRHWLKEIAVAQVDDVLDTLAVTDRPRRALEEIKNRVAVAIEGKIRQVESVLRCAVNSRSGSSPRFQLAPPRIGPISEFRADPRIPRVWVHGSRPPSSYLPPIRGAFATEWRSCSRCTAR